MSLCLRGKPELQFLYSPDCSFWHPLDMSHPRKRTGHLAENNSLAVPEMSPTTVIPSHSAAPHCPPGRAVNKVMRFPSVYL